MATRGQLRILAYHGLWTTPGYEYGDRLFISVEQFEQRMVWLRNSPYNVLPLREAIRGLIDGTLPPNAVVITIDDGWSSTFTHMLPVLERLTLPATVYVTTWYCEHQLPVINVAVDYLLKRAGRPISSGPDLVHEIEHLATLAERERALRDLAASLGATSEDWWETRQFHLMTPDEIVEAQRRGLDIQLHTHRHRSAAERLDELGQEIADNRLALARFTGCDARSFDQFCYPSGEYVPDADRVLEEAQVYSATLVDQGLNAPGCNRYQLRRFLDGRSISQAEFEAYLSGALELFERAKQSAQGVRERRITKARKDPGIV
jgi:peptidoglycan/xylan/chitin deacetylase (PgdA/CDA1 family)